MCVGERETESESTTWSVAFLAVGKEKGGVQIMSTPRTVINYLDVFAHLLPFVIVL
jgi:hypothetical protein